MALLTLFDAAQSLIKRAENLGSLLRRDMVADLKLMGVPEEDWEEVIELAKQSLNYRRGRYYPVSVLTSHSFREMDQKLLLEKALRYWIRKNREAAKSAERRGQTRIDFIHPVQVKNIMGDTFQFLARDLSPGGIRILGNRHFLGQKITILLPWDPKEPPLELTARIQWTCQVADGIFENGGNFLELTLNSQKSAVK